MGFVEGMTVPGIITEHVMAMKEIGGKPTPILTVFVKTDDGTLQHDYFMSDEPFKGSTSRAESLRRMAEYVGHEVQFCAEFPGLKGAKVNAVPTFVTTKGGGFWKAQYLNPLVRGAMSADQLSLFFGAPSREKDHPADTNRPRIHAETDGKGNTFDPQAEDDVPF